MFILIFLFLSHAIVFSIFGLSLFALIVADTLSKYENGILNSKRVRYSGNSLGENTMAKDLRFGSEGQFKV